MSRRASVGTRKKLGLPVVGRGTFQPDDEPWESSGANSSGDSVLHWRGIVTVNTTEGPSLYLQCNSTSTSSYIGPRLLSILW
jgi:hypothetical protein